VARADRLASVRRRPTPSGPALTAPVVVFAVLLAAFGVLTDDVVDHDEVLHVDGPLTGALQGLRTTWLTVLMRVVTTLGSGLVVIPLLLVVGLLARRIHRSWGPMWFLAFAAGGATLVSTVVKLLVARPRPHTGALVHALGYGFPSGHSTTATAGWLSAAVLLSSLTHRTARRVVIGTVAALVVALVGLSRVYLGVHAPTDVLGGWALGALWLAAVIAVGRLLSRRTYAPPQPRVDVRAPGEAGPRGEPAGPSG
jgi:membrane-associated phospholipid phosphatase